VKGTSLESIHDSVKYALEAASVVDVPLRRFTGYLVEKKGTLRFFTCCTPQLRISDWCW